MYDNILVPTDGSERAEAATEHALAIAECFDSRVHAVGVVNVGGLATGSEFSLPAELNEELKTAVAAAVDSVADAASDAGLEAVTVGRPKAELLSYLPERDIDLVCTGTHGRTSLDRVLLGSTTEALIRRTGVPVVTVSRTD